MRSKRGVFTDSIGDLSPNPNLGEGQQAPLVYPLRDRWGAVYVVAAIRTGLACG